jgi:MinD-like ATPase involved in chromosome partitioning or flagellar assembly
MASYFGGKVITVASAKGGVGKTTIVSNLAGAYYLLGQRTLIIDLDVDYGSIALNLNTIPTKSLEDLVIDVDSGQHVNFRDYVTQYNEGIDFIASSRDPRSGSKVSFEMIEALISFARDNYDVVLIDTTHSNNIAKISAIDLSDICIQVTTASINSITSTKSIISVISEMNMMSSVRIVVNESFAKGNYSTSELETLLNSKVDYRIDSSGNIPDYEDHVMSGTPYILSRNFSSRRKNFYTIILDLARDLINSGDEAFFFKQRRGMFGRMFNSHSQMEDISKSQADLKAVAERIMNKE